MELGVDEMLNEINGYKTYIIGVAFLMFAIGGYILGRVSFNEAAQAVLTGLGLMGIRHSVEKVLNKE